jgi:hypothetical protein
MSHHQISVQRNFAELGRATVAMTVERQFHPGASSDLHFVVSSKNVETFYFIYALKQFAFK